MITRLKWYEEKTYLSTIALYCLRILAPSARYPDRRSTPSWYVIRTSLSKRQNISERHGKVSQTANTPWTSFFDAATGNARNANFRSCLNPRKADRSLDLFWKKQKDEVEQPQKPYLPQWALQPDMVWDMVNVWVMISVRVREKGSSDLSSNPSVGAPFCIIYKER